MLSLITAEQSGRALINSSDMTIRNPPRKDGAAAREELRMQLLSFNAPGNELSPDRGAACRRAEDARC